MKKLACALVFAVMLCFFGTVAYADSDYTLEIVNGDIGDDGSMTATINISQNSYVYSGSFRFFYNASAFELVDISTNQSGTNGKITYETNEDEGTIIFTYKANDEDGCTYGGEFATISLKLGATSESVLMFNIDGADTKNYDGDELSPKTVLQSFEVPSSFQTDEAQTTEAVTEEQATKANTSNAAESESTGFFAALWKIIKVIFIVLVVLVVLVIVVSFFTRRYFRNKRKKKKQ